MLQLHYECRQCTAIGVSRNFGVKICHMWFDIPVSLFRWLGLCSGADWVNRISFFPSVYKDAVNYWECVPSRYSV